VSTPYYEDDLVTLYHGDCREITAWLEADVLVTDPPYGRAWRQGRIEGKGGNRRPSDVSASHQGIANDLTTELRDFMLGEWSGPAAVFGDLLLAPPVGTQQVLIYRKPNSAGVRGATAGHRRDVEAIYLLGWWSGLGGRSSVLDAGYANVATGPAATGHPHAKSNATMQHLVSLAADGTTIADPFAGSGSTLFAAKVLGRRAVGVELEERYCEIAAKRLTQDTLFGGAA